MDFSESFAVKLTGKIMVIAVLVLFLVVLFVLLLQLYAQCFWFGIDQENTDPPQTRRQRRRRLVFASGQDPSVANPRTGLDPLVLRSLPILIFHPEDFKDGLECAVCLAELVRGEKARVLPKCSHGFHVDCIDMWFQSHSTCPLCRNLVNPEKSYNLSTGSELGLDIESQGEISASGVSSESPRFPTNVLFWGNQMQVSSMGVNLEEVGSVSQSTLCPSSSSRSEGMVRIDIPNESSSSSSLLHPGSGFSGEEVKSQVSTRLRSLKRLLSRERKVNCSNQSSSIDVEQEGRG